MIDSYITTVTCELAAIYQVYNKHIIPRALQHAQLTQTKFSSEKVNKLASNFNAAFDELLVAH
jgi:hypothetical protein